LLCKVYPPLLQHKGHTVNEYSRQTPSTGEAQEDLEMLQMHDTEDTSLEMTLLETSQRDPSPLCVDIDVIHVIECTRPSPPIFVNCKQSKTG